MSVHLFFYTYHLHNHTVDFDELWKFALNASEQT
jgi:hypothetical protein